MIAQILLCSLLAAASADQGAAPLVVPASWDRYEVLVERNIFSRQRGRPDPRAERAVPAPPPPERYLLLTGIVKQGEEWTAFLEDARTGAVNRLHVGDNVLQGRVAAITMDSIDYEKAGRVARIAIGGNLEGGATGRTTAGAAASASGGAAAGTSGAAEQSDVLERLRQRARRERQ